MSQATPLPEASSPLLVNDPALLTTVHLLEARRRVSPEKTAFRVLVDQPGADAAGLDADGLRPVTTDAFARAAERAAAYLIREGIKVGDRVLLAGPTTYEWALADFACWYAGAVVVPVYPSSSPQQAAEMAGAAGAELALVDGRGVDAQKLLSATPGVRGVDLSVLTDAPEATREELEQVSARWKQRTPQDIASIAFTSGTSGEPKPVQITHANFSVLVQNIQASYSGVLHESASTLILLPLSHVLARGLQLVCLHAGMTITHLDDPSKVIDVMGRVRPTFLVVVPRVLDKVMERLRTVAEKVHLGGAIQRAERVAMVAARRDQANARRPADAQDRGTRAQRAEFALWDRLLYSRVRKIFGGRITYLLSGAAGLRSEVGLFFQGAGLPVIQGYGLTETTAPATGQRPGDLRAGTVGPPEPGTTVRIAEDGEVLISGPGVCAGYGADAEHPLPAVDADGFLHTGDLGRLEDGHLIITGRKKDLIITAYGKNVSPTRWEEAMEADPAVSHAILVGEDKPFLLGVVFSEQLEEGFTGAIDAVGEHEGALRTRISTLMERVNEGFSRPERPRALVLLRGGIDEDPRFVTPTGKVRRGPLLQEIGALIEAEYNKLRRG